MSDEFGQGGYEAPTVREDTLDSGGNYVPLGGDDGWGPLGSTGDPQGGGYQTE